MAYHTSSQLRPGIAASNPSLLYLQKIGNHRMFQHCKHNVRVLQPAVSTAASNLPDASITLHYFELPGRAEATRLILTIGGIEFKDNRFPREQWPSIKPLTPFGQVPALQIGDLWIGQSAAITHYAAKLAGLYPEDPLQAALADQAYFQMEDCSQVIGSVNARFMGNPDKSALVKARQEAMQGPFKDKLKALERLLERSGSGYFAGDKLTFVDIHIFNTLSFLASGFFEGIPTNYLEEYPALKAFRNSIASLPAIKAFYENETDELRRSYRPDA